MLRTARWFFGLCLLITIGGTTVHAQTVINAASCNASDVQTAFNSVTSSTTTVNIPSGTCTWTTSVTLTVPSGSTSLTIQGQTTVSCTGTAGTSSYACIATDNTIIQDAYAVTCCKNQLLIIETSSVTSSSFRMTGMTFKGGNIGSVNNSKQPIIQFGGHSQNFRVDHNHFNTTTYVPANNPAILRVYGPVQGVLDHNLLDMGSNASVTNGFQSFNAINDNIGSGDGTWASPTGFGSSAWLFYENNVFNGSAPNDCAEAGRFVMRYNTINSAYVGIQVHATKTPAGRVRGCRAYEAYHNFFTGPANGATAIGIPGASGLIWANTVNSGYTTFLGVHTNRNDGSLTETNTPNGWGFCGTSAINPSTGLANGVGSAWDGNSPSTTGWPCLDGIGRGQTVQALNGQYFTPPPGALNSSTGTIAWPQQYLEPTYAWMTTILNGATLLHIGDITTTNNRDVYVDNVSFTGATGTGYGVLASRPSTCTAGPGGTYGASPTGSYGVAYFATDANSGQGELYVCTSTNTWTPVYEPYAYPHPLIAGGTSGTSGNVPDHPTNLSATVQ